MKTLSSESGNVTLIGMVITLLLSANLLSSVQSLQETNKGIIERSQLHLCYHYLKTNTKSYLEGMAKQNIAIKAAHTASFIPPINKAAIPTFKALKAAQQLYHISYMKKFYWNDYCNFTQLVFHIKNMPYKANAMLLLKRGIDGTARLKHKKWKLMIPSRGFLKDSKYGHLILSKMSTKGRYQGALGVKSYEIGKEGAQSLKRLFGALSSSSWGQQISKLKNILKIKTER